MGAVVIAALGALVVGVEGEAERTHATRPLRETALPFVRQVSSGVGARQEVPRHVHFEKPPQEPAAPLRPPGGAEVPQGYAQGGAQPVDPLQHFVGGEQPQMLQAAPPQQLASTAQLPPMVQSALTSHVARQSQSTKQPLPA